MAAKEADYVILGGGSAGCVMAARLSEDPSSQVALLEAGPWDRNPWIHIPMGFARLYVTRKFDWNYQTEAEPELGGRSLYWPRGRVIGGSGSVNGLVFLRGSPRDYDRWSQSGARGWSYDDCLPAFRRMETFADTIPRKLLTLLCGRENLGGSSRLSWRLATSTKPTTVSRFMTGMIMPAD